MYKAPVTVILLTLNEEFHIAEAIDNIKDWAEDIFVVDSFSTDRTIDILLAKGIKVVQRRFCGFGDQWNFALQKLPIRTPWTMKMDPDERLSKELKQQLTEEMSQADQSMRAFSFSRYLFFMGQPLGCCDQVLRVWRTGECRFSDVRVNEHPLVSGESKWLCGQMFHLDSRDLHHWMEKQNRYSSLEAIMRFKGDSLSVSPSLFGNRLQKKMWFKENLLNIPGWSVLLFCYNLFVRGAWRSGRVGVIWCHLRNEIYRVRGYKYLEMKMTGRLLDLQQERGEIDNVTFDPRIASSELQQQVMRREREDDVMRCHDME